MPHGGRSTRDSQRSRLYRSEDSTVPTGKRFGSVAECQAYVDSLTSSRWFQSRWGEMTIEVKDGRGRRSASGSYWGKYIKLPLWARREQVILHEIAHVLTSPRYASHGPEYAGIYVSLMRQFMGKDAGDALRSSMRKHRVRVNMAGMPKPKSRPVVFKTAELKRAASWKRRPVSSVERVNAVDVLRRAVKNGEFGEADSKQRRRALEVARTLEAR